MAEIRAITGDYQGASIAFECSGVQAGLDTAVDGTRVRGRTIIVSLWEEKPSIDVFGNVVLGEKYITGAAVYDDGDFDAVIEAIASGKSCFPRLPHFSEGSVLTCFRQKVKFLHDP